MPLFGDEKRAYQLAWINKRRQDWLDENGPCVLCGSSDRLQVDHIDPENKALNPARLWSLGLKNPIRILELSKCQVLCYDCHKVKTKSQLEQTDHLAQGATLYRNGCRCDGCTKNQVERVYEWRSRRSA